MENQQLWIEPVANIIIARIRGVPSEGIFRDCQERVLMLMEDMQHGKVLYDVLEMEAPPIDLVLMHQKFEEGIGPVRFRRAIVVQNTRIAYLARIAFGGGDYRVFYNDLAEAVIWLEEQGNFLA